MFIHVRVFLSPPVADRLKPIPKSAFSQHVKDMHKDRDRGFELEYQVGTTSIVVQLLTHCCIDNAFTCFVYQ